MEQGRPRYFAIRPVTVESGGSGQRFEAMFYPYPDQDYYLEYRYMKGLEAPTVTTDFLIGQQAHSETIIAACLYEAGNYIEWHQGEHFEQKWLERLRASIMLDRQQSEGWHFGYNGDGSDVPTVHPRLDNRRSGIVSYDP